MYRPMCFVKGCTKTPIYEGWMRNHDGFDIPTGVISQVAFCEEHAEHPWLCAHDPKSEWEHLLKNDC